MFEGVLERLVLKLFGEYVQEFNRDQLHVSIWAGDVVLTDLQLKVGALDSFRLPIEVLHGQISTLTIQIPWTRIASSPVQITIDGLYVLCGPQHAKQTTTKNNSDDSNPDLDGVDVAAQMAWTIKQRMLEQHESSKKALEEHGEGEEHASQSYSARIISKIISNLQLTVKHVHIRYEDATTLKGNQPSSTAVAVPATPSSNTSSTALTPTKSSSSSTSTAPPLDQAFAMGITIGELVAQTTDSKGEVKFVGDTDSGVTYKLVELRAGSVYWNSDVTELWQNMDGPTRIRKMKQMETRPPIINNYSKRPAASPSAQLSSPNASSSSTFLSSNLYGFDYILHPLDITMRAILHHGDNDSELLKVQEVEHHLALAAKADPTSAPSKSLASPIISPLSSSSSAVKPTSKYYLSFTLPHLSLQLRSSQYRDCVKILDHFSQTKVNQAIAVRMAKLPKFPLKEKGAERKRKQSVSALSATSSPRTPPKSSTRQENDDDDEDDEMSSDDSDEDEFCTPDQSPISDSNQLPMDPLDLTATLSTTSTSTSRFIRPIWCRPYWRHAIKCIILLKSRRSRLDWNSVQEYSYDRKRYITLWLRQFNEKVTDANKKKTISTSWLEPLSPEEKKELIAIEHKLSYESIVVFRALAEQQWKITQQMASTMKQKGKGATKNNTQLDSSPSASPPASNVAAPVKSAAKGGWWGMLGFKQGENAAVEPDAKLGTEEASFLASITLTPEQQRKIWEQEQSLPLFFKRLQVDVRLVGADFRLTQPVALIDGDSDSTAPTSSSSSIRRSSTQIEITRITWDGQLSLTQRLKNWTAAVSVTKLEVTDCSTKGTCFEKVLSSGTGASSSDQPLLTLLLDDSPRLLDSTTSADFRVGLQLQPIAFVISPLYLSSIMQFFYEKDTTAYLWAAAANWEKNARNELLTALTDHRELEIDVQVIQPTILLPTDCLKRTSTVLVSDLQLLRMVSRPPLKTAKKAHRPEESVSPAHSILPSDIESLTHVAPSNPLAYDSFQLHFQSCRLYTCSSVDEWQRTSKNYITTRESELASPQSLVKSSMLYIVDGAVDDDERIPAAAASPSTPVGSSPPASNNGTSSSPTSLSPSSVHHAHAGFDVSLVMYTCIDRFEKLRLKQARDKEKEHQRMVAELAAKGDHDAIAALPPLPLSYPLSKILIQGSLPHLNISVCASTLEVIRTIKEQLMAVFFSRTKTNKPITNNSSVSEAQTMIQLANQSGATSNTNNAAAGSRKNSSVASAVPSSIVTVRNNLECGFIVDSLVVHILRDRIARNARNAAVAAAAANNITSPSATSDMSFINPNAAPLFLFHLARVGGNFITNSAREISSSFQLASMRILDCLQKYGPDSKFAYLASSYPPPHMKEEELGISRQASRFDDKPQSVSSTVHASSAASSSSSDLIRIRYRYIFNPQRSDNEWETDDGSETEEQFLQSISKPNLFTPRVGPAISAATKKTINPVGVSSFIDLDFNTLYVNWNPNTIAAVLAYLRYDESVQSEKETSQVLNAAPQAASTDETKEGNTLNVEKKLSEPMSPAPASSASQPSTPAPAAANSNQTPSKQKSLKKVRVRSNAHQTSIISTMASLWPSAHKNITVLTARLRKLSINFNKENENRALWRLEMVHSTVEHRHIIHPSPFLFYLMTSTGTGHRSKKEINQGFISQASKDLALGKTSSSSPNPAAASSINTTMSVSSAHLSRDPVHSFITKGALGNVHIYDLDTDKRLKYREMLGLKPRTPKEKAASRRNSLTQVLGGLHIDTSYPERKDSFSNDTASVASVFDFSFASNQLEVVQRRAWCIRRRKEINWLNDHTDRDWHEAAAAVLAEANTASPTLGPSNPSASSAPSRFPSMPDFADTHLMVHVNALRVVYLQQPTMELIDYFNEGIIGAIQAKLTKRGSVAPPTLPIEKYHKMSITLSNPQVIVPRNSSSNTHLVAGLRQIKVSNTVQRRRIILGVDVQGGTFYSSELQPDGSFPTNPQQQIDGDLLRPPMLELECFVTCILPQPDYLKQPSNEKYFDSITEVDATTLKGTMSWAQYVLLLNIFNENIRAPAPVRPKIKENLILDVNSAPPPRSSSTSPSPAIPSAASSLASIMLPTTAGSVPFGATPSLNDAPTVTYHIFDERPPLTLDIRIHVGLAQVKFLLGNGYVASENGMREDGLAEINIQDITYIFQTFSSRHMHQTARVHSVTVVDLREASRNIPFKRMLCPFSQIRERHYFKPQAPTPSATTSSTTSTPVFQRSASAVNASTAVLNAAANSSSVNSIPSASSSPPAEAELYYLQHDFPSGERDMQMNIFKPCGFVIPDFWMDLVGGFLFSANDSAAADQQAMMKEWTKKQLEVNGELNVGSPKSPSSAAPRVTSPRPLSMTTGAALPGYTPSPYTTPKRPFRCFKLDLKNSRFIVLEDLTYRHCRALVTTCDTTMTYTSEEMRHELPPPTLVPGSPSDWWTAWEWARKIEVTKLRMFVCASATNPVIHAAHSVVTPLNIVLDQNFKTEKRYYEPKGHELEPAKSHSSSSSVSTLSRVNSFATLNSPIRLEVHDQLFLDIRLSSASGLTDEPIELRASYSDFKLITNCLESLSDQQQLKQEEQQRAKAHEERMNEEKSQRANSTGSLHANYTSSTGTGIDPSFRSSTPATDSDSELDDREDDSPSPKSVVSTTSNLVTDIYEPFAESVKMFNFIWKNQLTFVVINDCSQRYVPLLHARILPGDALYVAKHKELDDEELDEDDEDGIEEEGDTIDEENEAGANEEEKSPAEKKQTALERAKSFLQKLKGKDASKSTTQVSSSSLTSTRSRSHTVKNVVDFQTIAVTLLLEVTYFNPKVVCWEPLIEPAQIDLKCQYETPNVKSSSHHQHHSTEFGRTDMSTSARRRMRGAVVVHNSQTSSGSSANNIPAWTITLTCGSRINVNISYIFLQHLYTTLQSWSADSETHIRGGPDANANAAHQAFSPYFIRNLTGAEVLYRCRNIIRESTTSQESSRMGSSMSASNAFALHDRIAMHSEFASNPSAFIEPIGPNIKKRVTSSSSVPTISSFINGPDLSDEFDPPFSHEEDRHQKEDIASNSTASSSAEDGLESVHVLPSGAEEQLSLRLITGQTSSNSTRHRRSVDGKSDDSTDWSAEDDVYRSILASRAPFSLRVRLAGGWVALNDLVVNKVGTTSYVLQMDPDANLFKLAQSSSSGTSTPTKSAPSSLTPADSVTGAASFLHSTNSPQPPTGGVGSMVITDYFQSNNNAPTSASASTSSSGLSLGQMFGNSGLKMSGAAGAVGAAGQTMNNASAIGIAGPRPATVSPVLRATSVHGVIPGSSQASTAAPMMQLNQVSDRKQLLFVDVVLRDGSKIVTLRSPIELVNRTNKPLCFLLHAHPTTPRRQHLSFNSASPIPDWQQASSAFLQSKDAYAVLGPVPAGGTINVPFSLTHLDFVSVMPVSDLVAETLERQRSSAGSNSPLSGASSPIPSAVRVSSMTTMLSGAASLLHGHASSSHINNNVSPDHSFVDDAVYHWSDTPLSQSSLMRLVHEQSSRYAAAHATAPPPGVVTRLQCHKDASGGGVDGHDRFRADSSFLLHVQAVHGSGAAPSSVIGGGSGESLLTLSLVFTPPFVLRNLFPYGIDFRIAYTKANPATALMNYTHTASVSHPTQNILSVSSSVAPLKKQPTEGELKKEKAAEKERQKVAEKAAKAAAKAEAKNPSGSSMPNRLDQTHPLTNGKAKFELWGHLASGQHLYFDHLNLDRDPYLMFRLDGFTWSERIPLGHLNQEELHEPSVGSTSTSGTKPSHSAEGGNLDYTISTYLMKQHIARHYVTIEDNNGNVLITQLESRRAGPQNGGLELDVYVQYWLINRTGLDLLYGSRLQESESESDVHAVIRTLPGHGGRVELCTYENQRYHVLDGWSSPYLPTDRPAWSDESGADRPKDWFRLPADDGSWMFEGDWRIDYGQAPSEASSSSNSEKKDSSVPPIRQTDANGWEYAIDFVWNFHPKNATLDAVRRRRWVRSYVSTRSLKPLCLHSTNMRGLREELCVRVAPLTKSTEYHPEMHTKSGLQAPLLRIRKTESPWSEPFNTTQNSDGLLLIQETQSIDVANEVDLEQAKWKRAASHVMSLADAGLDKGKFQLSGSDAELGPLAPHVTPRAHYSRENRYDLGVAFQPCPGIFHRTQMITFTPRFVLVNQLPYTLLFRQAGAHHRGRVVVLNIESGRFQPFWWQDIGQQPIGSEKQIQGQPPPPSTSPSAPAPTAKKPTSASQVNSADFEARKQHLQSQNTPFESLASIAFTSTSSVRWRWTGAFPIDEVGELSIACRSNVMTSRFLKVKILLEGATVFVVFKEENLKKPRYRLQNSTDMPMWYRQSLHYVKETKEQVLLSLPKPFHATEAQPTLSSNRPTAAVPSTSPSKVSPSPSASSSSPPLRPAQSTSVSPNSPSLMASASTQPIIAATSLSPWLYLAPGESTPFAWQEILVPKPYLLEIVTATPYVPNEQQSPAKLAELTHQATPPPLTTSSSFFSRGSPSRDQQQLQRKVQEAAARQKFEASIRERLGPYQFHFCDTVQLDEIGYSLINMESQTFIDVYVEDDDAYDHKHRRSHHVDSSANANDSSVGGPSKGGATKIMKLVRRKGVTEMGVAEAAAVLQQEQRARSMSQAARGEDEEKYSSTSSSRKLTGEDEPAFLPSKQHRMHVGSDADAEYVPVHRRELQVEKTSLYFEFVMPKFSLSLIDHLPRELALFSLRDLKLTYSSSNIYQKFELLLGDCQIDNQMADAMFNVVLHQKQDSQRVVGKAHTSDKRGSSGALISTKTLPPRPFIHFSCIRLTKYSSLEHYKYVGVLVQEFVLKLDQSFILACIPFLDVFYNARFHADTNTQTQVECSSMEDLEHELGLPLANEEEYVQDLQTATTIQDLEAEFAAQLAQLSHHKAVLATLQSKLNVESGGSKTPEQQTSIRILEDEIARTKLQYHRLLELNQQKGLQIQESQQARFVTPPTRNPLLSPTPESSGPSYRAAHVSSVTPSWIEGSDQRHQQFRTRHGHPESQTKQPYKGWQMPVVTQKSWTPDDLPPAITSANWLTANSNQNVHVMRTLTALVNSTLARVHSTATQRARKERRKSSKSAVKRTEEDELDQIYYLENVEINSVQCIFSFFTLPSYVSARGGSSTKYGSHGGQGVPTWFVTLGFGSHDSNPELLSSQTQALANAISSKTLMIANAEDAHIKLTGLHITHSFTTISDMMHLLTSHYHRQLNMQLFELVGASHVLGNPIGLISSLGTGVFDLVNEPISGAIKGPAAFGVGVAVGVGSFVKYSVRGVASTASSLLGTMGNASATLTADPEYLRKRKLGRIRQPKHLASGLVDGTRHLAKGVFDGVTGIFTSPVEGALNEGAVGFMKGIGRGLLGVVVKPVTGVFDAVTTVTDGIKNTTTLFEKRILPQRPPRIMYGPDQLIRVYSVKELSASCFLDTKGNIRLNGHQRETYQDHLTIQMHPSKVLLKENELRMKQQMKDIELGLESGSATPSNRGSPTSRSRSNSEAGLRDDLDGPGGDLIIPSSMHITPSSMRRGDSSTASSGFSTPRPGASPSKSLSASSLLTNNDPWDIAFVLTDHSLVCVKLDMKGNMSASQNNSSSSSARATIHTPHTGGHISSLLDSSAGTTTISKYAKVIWNFLWIQLQDIDRRQTMLTLRILVSQKQAKELRKSDKFKALFPFAFESAGNGLPHSALAAFSSSSSYFSSSSGRTSHAPLLCCLTIPCPNIDSASRLESMVRLAQLKAQAESGGGVSATVAGRSNTTNANSNSVLFVPRAQVTQQIEATQ